MEITANAVFQTMFQTAYHVVWIPKCRRRILTGRVAARLRQILSDIADKHQWRILAVEIQPDHLHVFLSIPPTMAVAEAVRRLKGTSARCLRAACPHLRAICRNGHLWAPS